MNMSWLSWGYPDFAKHQLGYSWGRWISQFFIALEPFTDGPVRKGDATIVIR
ncbi:hypothetical protein Sinac_0961 [Singulisphaera acidiphila DSM 18658]|uniref:Uncharacterized protein n=1 Tax=Singulisphaera acidiphila (strain ATCC BAA-1392 / DSM 18658 / VKM B-2454 / MOB10) TaxID=886293 RepID=L0D7L3_SINAD|nr:hypothetical protein Sinac_0961 [Singulisphaera acidiphila DSM 18658]